MINVYKYDFANFDHFISLSEAIETNQCSLIYSLEKVSDFDKIENKLYGNFIFEKGEEVFLLHRRNVNKLNLCKQEKGDVTFPCYGRVKIPGIRGMIQRTENHISFTDELGIQRTVPSEIKNELLKNMPDNCLIEVLYSSKDLSSMFIHEFDLIIVDVLKIDNRSIINDPTDSRISHLKEFGDLFSVQEIKLICDEKELTQAYVSVRQELLLKNTFTNYNAGEVIYG